MQREHAQHIAKILTEYSTSPVNEFSVSKEHSFRPLVGFHKWADGKPHVATFLVERDDQLALYFVLVDFRENGEYYLVVYPRNRSNPHAEIWTIGKDPVGRGSLEWTYSPSKQDGRNPERVAHFQRSVGDSVLRISLPSGATDAPRFMKDVFDLVDARGRADNLDNLAPESRGEFPEGAAVERLHKSRERNSGLVARAKRAALVRDGKLACEVCAFDFGFVYGANGKGFIEAHHLRPLSELLTATVSRIEDLALVCSNCHRMLHRVRPWLGRYDLKRLIADRN